MKFLETRTEIAKAINFKQYPTIRIDVSETDDYGIVGTHVLIDNGTFRTGEPYYVRATIRAYRALGFQDGRRFDPASRLSDGVPGQLMIGG